MARPARVRMRNRKPWTFARRRLLGWNVRLLKVISPKFELRDFLFRLVMDRTGGGRPPTATPSITRHTADSRVPKELALWRSDQKSGDRILASDAMWTDVPEHTTVMPVDRSQGTQQPGTVRVCGQG